MSQTQMKMIIKELRSQVTKPDNLNLYIIYLKAQVKTFNE